MNPLRILIVDDEELARNRMLELLEDCMGEVPHAIAGKAANGLEALELLRGTGAELALVDIHMPGMSGMELARPCACWSGRLR